MLSQTLVPDEILILKDGPLTSELNDVLKHFKSLNQSVVKIISFKKNRGLGPVLADGVILARNNLIARMDSDDIADPTRCEKQINYFINNPSYDIIGSNVTEFKNSIEKIVSSRIMPQNQDDILAYSRKRNPFAHPSVMFKKDTAISAGNYRDYKLCEDYDLWVRMIKNGSRCYNIQKNLVSMRLDNNFYARRGGFTYVRRIVIFKKELLDSGYCSFRDFLISATSTVLLGMLPNILRSKLYYHLLRTQKPTAEKDRSKL